MKTNKYFTILAAATLAFSACSSDDLVNNELPVDPQNPTEGEAVALTGSVSEGLVVESDDEQGTRMSVSTDGSQYLWEAGDKVSVTDGTLSFTYKVTDASAGTTNCTFEVASEEQKGITNAVDDDESNYFSAFYPASAILSWSGRTVNTRIYTEQNYEENMGGLNEAEPFGPYMAAYNHTENNGMSAAFKFAPVCSVIDVNLTDFLSTTTNAPASTAKVEAVSIYANSQVSIAGTLSFNTETKVISVPRGDATDYSASKQSETVTVGNINKTIGELKAAFDGEKAIVRFFVMPVTITGGVTVTVRFDDGSYYTKTTTNSIGNSSVSSTNTLSFVDNSSYGITGGNVCKPYYKTISAKSSAPFSKTQNWMAMIPGNVKFNFLSLPGTHDAATSSCSSSVAKCQGYMIAQQLNMGCRALDLRPAQGTFNSNLEIYHGSASTGVTLTNALDAVTSFLDANPTETVFVLIHEESASNHSTWAQKVWSCLNGYRDKNNKNYIADYGWSGNLNPCRGKMVVICRDEYTDGGDGYTSDLGCGKVGWGSGTYKTIMTGSGSSTNSGYTLGKQDEYETNKATKISNLETMLTNVIAAHETDAGYTFVNNTNSTYGKTLPNVSEIATEVNEAILDDATFKGHTGRFGIMMTDFLFSSTQMGDQMFDLIHKQNYKYVYKGRSRCETTTSGGGSETGVDIATDEYADGSQVYSKRH